MRFLFLAFLISGCAARSAKSVFPSLQETEALTQTEAPQVEIGRDQVDVAEWEIKGPISEEWRGDTHAPATVFEKALQQHVKSSGSVLVDREDMHCLAREMGHFHLAHKGYPTAALRDFMMASCGINAQSVQTQSITGDVDEAVSDDEVFAAWKNSVGKQLSSLPAKGLVGAWFGRAGKKAVWVMSVGQEQVQLQPYSRRPNEKGELVLRGRILMPVTQISHLVTQGEWGYSECRATEGVKLPDFEFACPVQDSEVISLYRKEPNRFLAQSAFNILSWPKSNRFRFVSRFEAEAGTPKGTFEQQLLVMVNRVRGQLQRAPLTLEGAQSDLSRKLAPFYFDDSDNQKMSSSRLEKDDLIALGLIAGWKVEQPIVDGGFMSAYTLAPQFPHRMAENLLRNPSGRRMLLADDRNLIAIGAHQAGGLGVLLSTYQKAKSFDHDAMVEELFKKLNEERAKKGLSTAKWIFSPPDADKLAAQELASGQRSSSDVLDSYMKSISAYSGSGLRGWVFETSSLESISFPAEMLNAEAVGMICTVGQYRAQGEPWVKWVVFLVLAPMATQA